MSKNLEYLDLEIKTENYNLCRRLTTDRNKLVCYHKADFSHRLHSTSNTENFEQLNTIIDLLCNLSEKTKINLEKLNKSTENVDTTKTSNNLIYIKELLEDILSKPKNNNEKEIKNEINKLSITIKRIESELIEVNKVLTKILYGK